MCGRFEIHSPIELIATIFGINSEEVTIRFKPNYNIAPTDEILAIVGDGRKRLAQFRWGFIPSWAGDGKAGPAMINARAETVAEKPAFRDAFRKQRCLVPADGFYEWKKAGKTRNPVYVHLKSGAPMTFAGLYSAWTSPRGETVNTCAIIVTDANDLLAPIHDRMPVIVKPGDRDTWLDSSVQDPSVLRSLLQAYPSEELEIYAVSPSVNSVKSEGPELIKAVSRPE